MVEKYVDVLDTYYRNFFWAKVLRAVALDS